MRADREVRREEPPLDVGVVGDAGRRAEQLLVDLELDRRLVVRGRHQDALVRRDLQRRAPSARRDR